MACLICAHFHLRAFQSINAIIFNHECWNILSTLIATGQGFAYACNHIRWELQLQRRWGVRHLKNRLWELFLQVLVHKTVRFQKEKDQHKMFKISKYFLILQISFSPLWKSPLGSILNAVQLIFHILIFSSKVFVSFGPAEMICENFPLLPSPLSTPEKTHLPTKHRARTTQDL